MTNGYLDVGLHWFQHLSLCVAHGRKGTVASEVTLVEMPSSDGLLEAGQTLRGGGGRDGWRGGPAPTFALEAVGGRGEQKPVSHGLRATAAGDARLLVPSFHPL